MVLHSDWKKREKKQLWAVFFFVLEAHELQSGQSLEALGDSGWRVGPCEVTT